MLVVQSGTTPCETKLLVPEVYMPTPCSCDNCVHTVALHRSNNYTAGMLCNELPWGTPSITLCLPAFLIAESQSIDIIFDPSMAGLT